MKHNILLFLFLFLTLTAEAKNPRLTKHSSKNLRRNYEVESSSSNPYVPTPFSLPPFGDVMGALPPSSLPENNPPFCINPPPFTSLPPNTYVPIPPVFNSQPPPIPPKSAPLPPILNPNPPESPPVPYYKPSPLAPPSYTPSPPTYVSAPPPPPWVVYVPSPPIFNVGPPPAPGVVYVPSPPTFSVGPPPAPGGVYVPSPPTFNYGPPVFQPPVVYPPPSVPPSPISSGGSSGLWCVAKPSVPDPIIMEAMNYACGSGADCQSIQQDGACFEPNTVIAHASYAFNSYWQRTKVGGGTCDFGGTAMLVTKDPSNDGCHFIIV
ncbi:Glucan endo-1,3-beta-D-glucosidase [Acorus gramineus]|uniref:Glucan endo-1,3-beta-D-glucosidase n=1 Tax=Acorus gramineus TaxID=55184 RepID=A0AAV9A1Y0_ACOGR|nr:Glucan endo-1,3-beta-D-glucosidase [Acorus gramineus]